MITDDNAAASGPENDPDTDGEEDAGLEGEATGDFSDADLELTGDDLEGNDPDFEGQPLDEHEPLPEREREGPLGTYEHKTESQLIAEAVSAEAGEASVNSEE